MKKDIHPKYNDDAKIKCACGAEFKVGSTEKEISVEICSACHPFFTGKEKLVDTAGRVDKFKMRQNAAKKHQSEKKPNQPRKNQQKAKAKVEKSAKKAKQGKSNKK